MRTEATFLCIPNLLSQPDRFSNVAAALRILNTDWRRERCGHYCRRSADGAPCCATLPEAVSKVRWAISVLLLSHLPLIPCLSRWLTSTMSMGWWALGMTVCRLFPRAWLAAYPVAARALRVRVEDLAPDDQDPDVEDTDDWKVRLTKKLRRGGALMEKGAVTIFQFLFTLLLLAPLNRAMCMLMEVHEGAAYIAHTVVTINLCLDTYVRMLCQNPATGRAWLLLHGVVDLNLASRKRLMRREICRCYCGVDKRLAQPLRLPASQVLLAVQLVRNIEDPTEDELEAIQGRLDILDKAHSCCQGRGGKRLSEWMGPEPDKTKLIILRKAISVWRSNIQPTERRHSGNKRRAAAKQGKARSLRRQVAAYVCSQAAAIFRRGGGRDLKKSLTGITYAKFRARARALKKRTTVGSSHLNYHINSQSKSLAKQGYSRDQFHAMRRVWAQEAKDAKKSDATPQQQALRESLMRGFAETREEARRTITDVGVHAGLFDTDMSQVHCSHCGMGDNLYPIGEKTFAETLSARAVQLGIARRGGIRRLGDEMLPEMDLAVPGENRKLLCEDRVRECGRDHPGRCTTEDAGIKELTRTIKNNMKASLPRGRSGDALVAFFPPGPEAAGDDDEPSLIAFYAADEGNPSYGMFFACDLVKGTVSRDGPSEAQVDFALAGEPIATPGAETGFLCLQMVTTEDIAKFLAEDIKHGPVRMVELIHEVGDLLSESMVSHSTLLCEDAVEVQEKTKTKVKGGSTVLPSLSELRKARQGKPSTKKAPVAAVATGISGMTLLGKMRAHKKAFGDAPTKELPPAKRSRKKSDAAGSATSKNPFGNSGSNGK